MKIPRIEPGQAQMTGASQATRVDVGQLRKEGESLALVGKTIESVAGAAFDKLKQARDTAETLTAKRKSMEGLADIAISEQNALGTDGDRKLGKEEDFIEPREKMRVLKENVLKSISNRDTRDRFELDFDLLAMNAEADIKKTYMSNIINKGQAETNNASDIAVVSYGIDGYYDIEGQLERIWGDSVKAGYYAQDVAYNKKEKALKEARNNRFIADAKIDRDLAKRNLEKNIYKFDPKEMDTALSTLVHFRDLEQKNELITKIDNRFNFVDALATGKESLFELSPVAKDIVKNDDILAEAVSRATSRKGAQVYYSDTYEETIQMFEEASQATNGDDLSGIAASAIYRNKTINPEILGGLLFYASQRAKTLRLSEKFVDPLSAEDTEFTRQQKLTDMGINSIARWARTVGADTETHSKVITSYMKQIQEGIKPAVAVQGILRSTNLSLNPSMVNFPEEGQLIVDPKGNQAMAFPNGDLLPVMSKQSSGTTTKTLNNKSGNKKKQPDESISLEYEDLIK